MRDWIILPAAPISAVAEILCARHGITLRALLKRTRQHEVSRPRHDVMLDLYEAGRSYVEIARFLGMDHTSVLHGVRRARQRRAQPPKPLPTPLPVARAVRRRRRRSDAHDKFAAALVRAHGREAHY